MGVQSDLIVAPADAKYSLLETPPAALPYPRAAVKGLNQVHLHSLHSILFASNASSMDPAYFGDSTSTALDEDGPWLFEVPMMLVRELADLTQDTGEMVCHFWAQTDEFICCHRTEADSYAYLQALCEMSQQAVANDCVLYLWVSQ